jgi:hypothetical protein
VGGQSASDARLGTGTVERDRYDGLSGRHCSWGGVVWGFSSQAAGVNITLIIAAVSLALGLLLAGPLLLRQYVDAGWLGKKTKTWYLSLRLEPENTDFFAFLNIAIL